MQYQFLHCAKEWSKLSEKIRNIDSLNKFKSSVLSFIRSRENSIFAIHDINVVKLLNRLTLNYTYLNNINFGITLLVSYILSARVVYNQREHFTTSCVVIFHLHIGYNSLMIYIYLETILKKLSSKKYPPKKPSSKN